ncbi:MAG: hypothetical protein ACPL1Y_06685 [Thermoplasmata archaeon]
MYVRCIGGAKMKNENIKIWATGVVAIMMLTTLFAVAGAPTVSAETRDERISYVNETSELFGGGTVVGFRVRDITFGVLFGNPEHNNSVIVFDATTRYFGGAELYDTNGNYLGKRGIPITTICAQRFDFLSEFQRVYTDQLFSPVERIKSINLNTSWEFENLTKQIDDINQSAKLTFTLSAYNLPYNPVDGHAVNGTLERISLTFHLVLRLENRTIENVPWYKVTVDRQDNNKIVGSEFLRYENYSGKVVNGSFKYDHLIEGWDFATNRSALALGTTIIVVNYVYNKVAEWLHVEYGGPTGIADNQTLIDERNQSGPQTPRVITRDSLAFRDNWQRIGVFRWVSDVNVDGVEKHMMFQVHAWERLAFSYASGIFRGFGLKGAFLYPQGNMIYHDPGLNAEAAMFTIPDVDAKIVLRAILVAGVLAVSVAGIAVIAYLVIRKRIQ